MNGLTVAGSVVANWRAVRRPGTIDPDIEVVSMFDLAAIAALNGCRHAWLWSPSSTSRDAKTRASATSPISWVYDVSLCLS